MEPPLADVPLSQMAPKRPRLGEPAAPAAAALHDQEDAGFPCDLVIENGRIIDPANGVDAVRDIAVRDGVIVRIGERLRAGGLVATDVTTKVRARGGGALSATVGQHAHICSTTPGTWHLGDLADGSPTVTGGGRNGLGGGAGSRGQPLPRVRRDAPHVACLDCLPWHRCGV